jgi:hypothetical protein
MQSTPLQPSRLRQNKVRNHKQETIKIFQVYLDYQKDEIFKISQRDKHLICIAEKEKEKDK